MQQDPAVAAATAVAALTQMLNGFGGELRSASNDRRLHTAQLSPQQVGMQVYQAMAGGQVPHPAPAMAPTLPPQPAPPPTGFESYPTAVPQMPTPVLAAHNFPPAQPSPDMIVAFLKVLDNIATTLTQIKVSLDTILNPTDENAGLHG